MHYYFYTRDGFQGLRNCSAIGGGCTVCIGVHTEIKLQTGHSFLHQGPPKEAEKRNQVLWTLLQRSNTELDSRKSNVVTRTNHFFLTKKGPKDLVPLIRSLQSAYSKQEDLKEMKNYIIVPESYTKDSEKEKQIAIQSIAVSAPSAMDQQRRRRGRDHLDRRCRCRENSSTCRSCPQTP